MVKKLQVLRKHKARGYNFIEDSGEGPTMGKKSCCY